MKFDIIYADPPWSYKTWSGKGKEKKSAENHYDCMTKNDIQNLPIKNMSSDNSVLFLWVTFPCLEEGMELIKKWGFTYKTVAFTWVKKNKVSDSLFWGLGYWTRANAEICLLATKGKPKRVSKSVHQVIEAKIGKHSQKPPEARERIVKLMGDLPRIELFAREKFDGWKAWGNEIECDINMKDYE